MGQGQLGNFVTWTPFRCYKSWLSGKCSRREIPKLFSLRFPRHLFLTLLFPHPSFSRVLFFLISQKLGSLHTNYSHVSNPRFSHFFFNFQFIQVFLDAAVGVVVFDEQFRQFESTRHRAVQHHTLWGRTLLTVAFASSVLWGVWSGASLVWRAQERKVFESAWCD